MKETISIPPEEIPVPNQIDEGWLAVFNAQFARRGVAIMVAVEEWLERPDPEEHGMVGSGEFTLEDAMSADGWWQTISGTVDSAGYTNVPHYSDTGFANVLCLTDASLSLPDGSAQPLAEGRQILLRLDRLKDNPTIIAGQLALNLMQNGDFGAETV